MTVATPKELTVAHNESDDSDHDGPHNPSDDRTLLSRFNAHLSRHLVAYSLWGIVIVPVWYVLITLATLFVKTDAGAYYTAWCVLLLLSMSLGAASIHTRVTIQCEVAWRRFSNWPAYAWTGCKTCLALLGMTSVIVFLG